MGELLELAERCELASGPDRELDFAIYEATGNCLHDPVFQLSELSDGSIDSISVCQKCGEKGVYRTFKMFTASLDAAMQLVPEGMDWFRERGALVPFIVSVDGPTCRFVAECDNSLPLALCAAALKARASQSGEHQ